MYVLQTYLFVIPGFIIIYIYMSSFGWHALAFIAQILFEGLRRLVSVRYNH
jgi:hypothetical protein